MSDLVELRAEPALLEDKRTPAEKIRDGWRERRHDLEAEKARREGTRWPQLTMIEGGRDDGKDVDGG
jgi:hypothetical protein